MKRFWDIRNKTDTSADIYLYDVIGYSLWEETTSAKDFKEELDAIGDVKTLNIYINSPGGSVFDGMAIYNQLKRHKAFKDVYVDGVAGSITSVIALAKDRLTIPKNGYFMIHEPEANTRGNATLFRKMADNLDVIEEGILNVYEEHSALTRDEIKQMMADETWMTGEQAFEYGFADVVGEEVQIAASVAQSEIWDRFKHPPKIKDEQQQIPESNPTDTGRVFDYKKRVSVREKSTIRRKNA